MRPGSPTIAGLSAVSLGCVEITIHAQPMKHHTVFKGEDHKNLLLCRDVHKASLSSDMEDVASRINSVFYIRVYGVRDFSRGQLVCCC